jgi:isopropylmalate/homocitrate/citramalate synthase
LAARAGLPRVESASFVNPKLVPAMAGAEEVFARMRRREGTAYPALVLNEKGYERALAAGVQEVRYGFSATDEFGLANQNLSTADGLAGARRLIARARADGTRIGVTISAAFGCPFSGHVPAARVIELVEALLPHPPDEVCLADTIGVAVPTEVRAMMGAAVATGIATGAHFHDTRNTAIANVVAALDAGVRRIDTSIGGTGGCPFAPRATGNVATEDVVYLLDGMGIETGVELEALIDISHWLGERLCRELPSLVARAGIPVPGVRAAGAPARR